MRVMKITWSCKPGEGDGIKWIRAHVDYQGDDCIYWPLSHGDGYGTLCFHGKSYRATRFMCKLAHGEPPTPKHQAAHECGNGLKGCLNPRHLKWKTNGENQLDRRRHGKDNRPKFTPEKDAQLRDLAKTKTQMELAEIFGVTRSTIQYRLYGGSHKSRQQALARGAA